MAVDFSNNPYCAKFIPLPEGWKWCLLEECVEILDYRRIPVNQKERDIRAKANLQSNQYPYYGATGQVGWIDEYIFDERLVLLGEDGAPFLDTNKPKAYLVSGKYWVNNHAHVLRAIPSILNDSYLRFYLNIFDYSDYVTGTTRLKLNQARMKAMPLLLPPIEQQLQIVSVLENIYSQIRIARTALERIPPTLKALRQSVLAAAFRGELTGRDPNDEPASLLLERIRAERRQRWQESLRARGKDPAQAVYAEPSAPDTTHLPELPEGWVWSKIGMVFDVSLGGTPARDKSEYWNGQVPWVSSGEVAFCRISGTKETITNVGLSNSNAKYNPAGSVLLAMIGEGKTRGQAAILDIPATTNQNIAAINVTTTPIKPEWLFYWFRYQYEDVRDGGVGGAQPALNAGRIKELVFPIAPKEELERTIRKLGEVDRYIESIETIVQVASRRLDALEQSALAKAFRGELV